MFHVHGVYIVTILYTIRVGFGIAYSVPRAMREPHERDKQSSRFPRFFFYIPYKQNTKLLWRSGNQRHFEVAPDTD